MNNGLIIVRTGKNSSFASFSVSGSTDKSGHPDVRLMNVPVVYIPCNVSEEYFSETTQ